MEFIDNRTGREPEIGRTYHDLTDKSVPLTPWDYEQFALAGITEPSILNQLASPVVKVGGILVAGGLASLVEPSQAYAQATKPPCIVRAHFRAEYFIDKGGETHPDGKPKYQEGLDEKLRVAAGREILATSGEISKKLTTDGAGIAFATVNGKSVDYAEFPCAKDSQTTTVNYQDLGNGDKGKREIPNGQQKTIDDMVATNNSTVDEAKKGPTFVPFTKEVPRTPGVPANATPGAKIDTTKSLSPVTGGNEGGNNSSSVKNPISMAADAIFNFPKENPELTKIIVVATVLGAYVLWRRRPGHTRRYIPRTRIAYA